MAKNKISERVIRTELPRFFGIDRSGHFGERGCYELNNMRLTRSGELIKRSGRRKEAELYANTYSVLPVSHELYSGGGEDLMIAAPPYIYIMNSETYEKSYVSGGCGEYGQPIGMVKYRGGIYIFDGERIVIYEPDLNGFRETTGYAPLYGKNWDPVKMGKINEPRNLLCGDIRISYKTGKDDAQNLNLGFDDAEEILKLEANGQDLYDYELGDGCIIGTFPANSNIEVWLRRSYDREGIYYCRGASVFGGGNDERVVLFGGSYSPTRIYCSKFVSDADIEQSRRGFYTSDALYFPEALSDDPSEKPITAICAVGAGFAAFTDEETFIFRVSDGKLEKFTVSHELGAVSARAVRAYGGYVYTVDKNGIFRLKLSTSRPYAAELEKISAPIEGYPGFSIGEGAVILENYSDGVLWFSFPEAIFVYEVEMGAFWCYPNMHASAACFGKKGFMIFEENAVWCFSDELYGDVNGNNMTFIVSTLRTRWLDFGESETEKKHLTVHPVFSIKNGSRIKLTVESDRGFAREYTLNVPRTSLPHLKSRRIAQCRFRSVRLSFKTDSVERPSIFSAVLTANSGK